MRAFKLAIYLLLANTGYADTGSMQESENTVARRAAVQRLHAAVRVGDTSAVDTALAAGADINRSSVLELAILGERTDMIDLLIERGADVNRAGPSGDLPLAVAARRGRLEMVQQLLDKGADPRLRDRRGMTALDHAQRQGRAEAVQFLQHRDRRSSSSVR